MTPRARIVVTIAVIAALVVAGLLAWALRRPEGPRGNPNVTLEAVRTGLAWPIALAFAPDGRVFYAERYTGILRILGTGTDAGSVFFTIPEIAANGEQGLLGLAIDPNFAQQPYLYAYYTRDDATNGTVYNRIVRIRDQGPIGSAMELVLDRIPANFVHNGGVIAFGPDETLYAVVGDAQDQDSAQDLSRLSGKVLRMNSDGSAPADNPFLATPGAHPLVFTYGHRNMFGITFHPLTGRVYQTENGPGDGDEVNLLTPGENYGWPIVQGMANNAAYVDPIIAYTPVIVPTNAAFYTAAVPAGSMHHLIVGSFNSGSLHELALDPTDGATVVNETFLATALEGILDVEMGSDGYLWLTTPSVIYRLGPASVPSGAGAFGIGLSMAIALVASVRPGRLPDVSGADLSAPPLRRPSRKP